MLPETKSEELHLYCFTLKNFTDFFPFYKSSKPLYSSSYLRYCCCPDKMILALTGVLAMELEDVGR